MNILVKAAIIVDHTAKELHLKKRDILIQNGQIAKIAAKIPATGNVTVFERKNLHVSKGWFDTSTSFGEPGFEERETISNGMYTAAKSGYTDIVLNPNAHPVPDSSADIIFLKNAAKEHVAKLHPLGTLTQKSEGIDLAELYDMHNSGAVGFYDHKKPVENSNLLKIALQYVQNFGGLVHSFPLDKKIAGKGVVNEGEVSTRLGLKGIPALAEELQIARDLYILEYTGGKLHIPTLSTAGAVKLISEAKKKGLDVTCSVALHNLFFTDNALDEFDSRFKVMPPLRTIADTKALIEGVKKGTVDYITADHAPLNIELKHVEFDNADYGTLGLETAFGIANLLFGMEMAVQLLTKGRARFGLEEFSIKEGAIANLTLFDPDIEYPFKKEHVISASHNSMFFDSFLKGKVFGVICNNKRLL